MATHHLLTISGALRAGSTNSLLAAEAARLFAPETLTVADLRVPLYDGDLEDRDGVPAEVQKLADQIAAADAVVISTPEYNQSFSGVLKNALDWVSRTDGSPWRDKPVAIMSAASGRSGGARAQFALRLAMATFGPRLLQSPDVMLADARNAFDTNGQLLNERTVASLDGLMTRLGREVRRSAVE